MQNRQREDAFQQALSLYDCERKSMTSWQGTLYKAWDILKPTLNTEDVPEKYFDLVRRILGLAIIKEYSCELIACAATYVKPAQRSERPSLDTVMHEAVEYVQGHGKLRTPAEFLTPIHSGAPSDIHQLAIQVWEYFRDHHWEVPGYKVVFHQYSRSEGDRPGRAYQVSEIRGKDFIFGFKGDQGALKEADILNCGGFSFIAVPNFAMEFYGDYSGPVVHEYTPNNWTQNLVSMKGDSICCHGNGWKEVDCRVPTRNTVFINFLFDVQKNNDAVQVRRESGQQNRDHYYSKAIAILKNEIIPNIMRSGAAVSAESVTRDTEETKRPKMM